MPEWKQEIRRRLANLNLEPTREAEIVEELSQHLQDHYEESRSGGATEAEAHSAALKELSDSELLARELRQVERRMAQEIVVPGTGRKNMIGDLRQDLRYGLRTMRKSPGFTAVAVLSLALGIGANTAIFQLLDAVRLRTLPVKNPQELTEVRITDMTGARGSYSTSHPQVTNRVWEQIRDQQQALSAIFAWSADRFNLATSGEARIAQGLWVSGDTFNVLGVQPILGRVFSLDDDQRGSSPRAVISYSFWQREFGGDASVVGRQLTVGDHPIEIIGVAPASFFGLEVGRSFDLAVPIRAEAIVRGPGSRLDSGTTWYLTVMGRLKPGWSVEQASNHVSSISPGIFEATLPADYPPVSVKDYLAFKLAAFPAGAGTSELREKYSNPLWLLLAIGGLVLLIACANLANLLLARASVREREIAVRLALGASRERLVRQLMAESLLLAAAGAGLGLVLAQGLSQFLVSFLSTEGNALFLNLSPDWRVLGFTIALAALTAVLFGLTPAFRGTRTDPGSVMKAGGRGLTASRERFSLRRALVVSQIALSLVLLVSALLFSLSLRNLQTQDAGLQQNGILLTNLSIGRLNIPAERRQDFKREIVNRIRAIPMVEAAADALVVPLMGASWSNAVWMDGSDSTQREESYFNRVSPDYFKTMKMPLLAGRDFDDHDTPTSVKVAIVTETFARRLGNLNPIGKTFWVERTPDGPEKLYEVVGLVRDAKYEDLHDEFSPTAFLSTSQDPSPRTTERILIRSTAPLANLTSSVKATIAEINPEIGIAFQVFETQIQNSLLRERLMATLSGFFGILALALACIGLYGILSYGVASRTKEIGIRIALGAERNSVVWLVMREALLLALIGVAIGLPAVLGAVGLVESLLYGVKPADPALISLAVLMMIVVAALAAYIPARRATKVDPMTALRYE